MFCQFSVNIQLLYQKMYLLLNNFKNLFIRLRIMYVRNFILFFFFFFIFFIRFLRRTYIDICFRVFRRDFSSGIFFFILPFEKLP